ncbi:type II secretion system F family protein [Thermodesulfobacteriota bacterium]
MAKFKWEGKTRSGDVQKGVIEAESDQAAITQLRSQQILPSRVKEEPKGLQIKMPGSNRVQDRDLSIFTRQLATMLDAGLPLVQCLDILANQQPKEFFKEVIFDIKGHIEKGSTFAESLQKHPKVFDDLYTNLVMAGEMGGILDVILNRLSAYIEKAEQLKKRVKGAMVYPVSILGVSVLVVVVLLVFVIPVFQKMFADFGAALPAPTQIVVTMSNLLRSYILFMIAGLGVAVYFFKKFRDTEKGRVIVDKALLRAPVFGELLKKIAVSRFTRTLGTLVSSGVPILDGLMITAKSAGNKVIEQAIMETRLSISEGKTIAAPLEECDVFPPMVTQMISVGESTGSLDAMLAKIADFYDDEVDNTVNNLTALMEPMMMVFLGVVIGGLMMAMYLPIFKMASVVG